MPEQILTDNGKVFTGRLAIRPTTVAFDRICLANGIRHLLTAPYSPTTTGKIERLHKTIRKEFLAEESFASIEEAQTSLDAWVAHYNAEREHQAIGDVAPVRRFEIVASAPEEIVDPTQVDREEPRPSGHRVARLVDPAGRIIVESVDGLLHVTHDGVLVATHARRHLAEDDARMDRRAAPKPSRPTAGDEVLRKVDPFGSVSFAGTSYRVGNRSVGQIVECGWSTTRCRSPRAGSWFARTAPVTTS